MGISLNIIFQMHLQINSFRNIVSLVKLKLLFHMIVLLIGEDKIEVNFSTFSDY